jgi:lipopolysaccharide transport system ATP-binding protein
MASLLEVGTGFHPELTGRENVFLNGAIMGMTKSEIRRKFDEIVDFSGVEKYIDTPVKRYSSGMYVRLAFAVAAHLEPEILIVDEVLAVGDAEFQKKCLGKMKSVSNQGRTVLFVSHNMSAIQSLCPRSILLKSGELIKDGATDQIIQYYLGNELTTSNEIIFDAQNELTYVKSLKLTHQDNSVGRAYKCGETLSFDFEIEADSAGEYQLGIGVASALDVNIFSELSEPIALHKGTQTIHYTNQQIKLAPGHYALTFNWLRNGKSIQYEEKILHFEVLELTTQDETYSIGKGAGFIVSKGLFKLK